MSRLVLGTAQFGQNYGIANKEGLISRVKIDSILALAKSHGIDTLDTAISYGESESFLGKSGVNGFKFITKLPALPDGCNEIEGWVEDQSSQSLKRLGASSIYALLLHNPKDLLTSEGGALFRALQKLKEKGQIQKIGLSIYSPDLLASLGSRFAFDLVQAPLNIFDQRLYKTGWLRRLKDENVEIHTRSVFLQGLLLMDKKEIPFQFNQWEYLWMEWENYINDNNISKVEACLAFPLSFPEIDKVIVGVDTHNQLLQIVKAESAKLAVKMTSLRCDDENLIDPGNWSRI